MKFQVEVPNLVLEEVGDAVLYYDSLQKDLGNKLYDDFESTLLSIEKSPLLFQRVHKNYRHAMLYRFPYLVIFRVFETKILINRFIHAKKQPAKRYK